MATDICFLSAEDLEQLLSMSDCIASQAQAFTELYKKEARVPLRTSLELDNGARALCMPVYSQNAKQMVVKTVQLHPENPQSGLPLIHALLTLYDGENGRPLAVMDGELITAFRTGAVAGLATDLLARAESSVAVIFGTGPQAVSQLAALAAVRPLEKVYFQGRDSGKTAQLVKRLKREYSFSIAPLQSRGELAEADIISTATTSLTPLFKKEELKEGVHINSVGSYRADMAEVAAEIVLSSYLVVDSRGAALAEAGDIVQPIAAGLCGEEVIDCELGGLLAGDASGRSSASQITFFKSVGVAVQDLCTASLAYEKALARGLGSRVQL